MLKVYEYGGMTYQFEEGEQPAGATEVKADDGERPKARKTATKQVKPLDK
ncbi:MAG: hypothetical protein PUI21_01575 [Collinsella sp.]|nr:hypothetical protein [Collinsella sp.]